MFESRVQLLSDYAERYMVKSEKIYQGNGFWEGLTSLFSPGKRSYEIYGTSFLEASEKDLLDDNYAPFCEIDQRKIYFRKDKEVCMVAIRCKEDLWDLSEWGEGEAFVTRLIAEVYFMVTRDDFKIDEDERKVLHALIGYIEPTLSEIIDARNMVYWTLVEAVMEDDLITEEEDEMMLNIREALQIKPEDACGLHRKALLERLEEAKEYCEENVEIDLAKLDKIKKMAEKLGVDLNC